MPNLKDLKITLTWQTITRYAAILVGISAGYYKMLNDIEAAARLPEAEVTRIEYDLKFELAAERIKALEKQLAANGFEITRLRDKVEQ